MALAFRRSSHRLILLRYAVCPFSSTPRSCLLVSPPDPISNIRHVIYDEGTATREGVKEGFSKHPYSLSEFSQDSFDSATGQNELQLKLQRQQLDTLDQQFWTDSNLRFEAGKADILSSLPEETTASQKEQALSEFYKQWLVQENDRTESYTKEWRARNWALILLHARVKYQRFTSRLTRQYYD